MIPTTIHEEGTFSKYAPNASPTTKMMKPMRYVAKEDTVAVGCWFVVVGCWFLVVGSSLLVLGGQSLTSNQQPITNNCLQPTTNNYLALPA